MSGKTPISTTTSRDTCGRRREGDVIENVHASSCATVSVLWDYLDDNVADAQEPPGALKPDQSGQSLRWLLRISNADRLKKQNL